MANTSGLKRGGSAGRPKGTPNKATVEARTFCASIVDDPVYQAKLRRRAIAGKLSPAIESLLWYYAKGKPKEHVDLNSDAELIALLDAGRLRNAAAKREAGRRDSRVSSGVGAPSALGSCTAEREVVAGFYNGHARR